ncbi:MAG: FtsX-like permease family protein [Balneolaceae bacterium]|nr:FtsX-like permease family protein [Balneolaceae bacterium]
MKNTSFIARRYLFSRKHVSLISTLTGISVIGVTIGTALLIVVLSVFNGFFEVIKGFLLENDPDLRIESAEGREMGFDAALREELAAIPEVRIYSPYIDGKALLAHNRSRDRVVPVRGIETDSFERLHGLAGQLSSGVYDLSVEDRQPGVLLSEQLMAELGINVGDEVALLSAEGMRKALTQFSLPRTYRFEVRGSYSTVQLAGQAPAYVALEAASRLFEFGGTVTGVNLRLDDHQQAEQVKGELQRRLGSGYALSTWYDLQRPLYDVMYLEKWGSYLILMIIVLVAALNIVGSLTMIVIQKNRDIGVLRTIGHTPGNIRRIFVKQGFYIGLIGCGAGGALGLLLSWLQKEYGLIKLSSDFILEAYPASISAVDVSVILLGSLMLCVAASWYPAARAAKVEPADAVRNE